MALPSLGRAGGILIIWDNRSATVTDNLVGQFSVSIKVDGRSFSWWLSGVYGPNSYRRRGEFWDELAGLSSICDQNWCIGGDFNVIRYSHLKSLQGRVTRSMRSFNDFIWEAELKDVALTGAKFTWSKLQRSGDEK